MSEKIRRINKSDRKDILEISRHIWEGHDYLPSVIDGWFSDPQSYTCGVEVHNQLVALANFRVIEGGRTGWMEGLRVHPDYRKRGYACALTEHLLMKVLESPVQRLRYTTSTENEASLKLAEKFGFKRLAEMGVFWHPDPKIIPPKKMFPEVQKSDQEKVYFMLQRKPDIIPNNILIYDWKALDATSENLATLGEAHSFYITGKEMELSSLSYGCPLRHGQLPMWIFTVYSTATEDFYSQLANHVSCACLCQNKAVMGTYQIKFERALHQIDWIPKNHWGTHLVLLEKILH